MSEVFKSPVYQCTSCGDKIFSKSEGHFASCSCGKSFVDATKSYVRVGGKPTKIGVAYYDKDKKEVIHG